MDDSGLVQLVENARGGCRESMGLLTEQFQDEIYRYIYRMTLNEDLANDLRQDTLLQMVQSLENLRDADKIRPWLYRTAWGKVKNHYRSVKRKQSMSIDDNNLVDILEGRCIDGLKKLIDKEIAETLVRTILELDLKQRSVLVMRCYENMSYSEIASTMSCSETTARVLFFRAKTQLKRRMGRKGVTTLGMLLGLLSVFGQVTSRTQAAVQVSAASLKVGGLGTIIGWALSKTGAAILSLTAGAAIVAGAATLNNTQQNGFYAGQADTEVKSFHFVKHAWRDAYIPNANLAMGRSLSKGAYEQWFFFPEGVDGPMFKVMQRWDPQIKNKLCSWLLDGDGQHYYNSGQNAIYWVNHPLAKRKTARFPSDSREFTDFLDRIEGEEEGVEYIRDPKTGMMIELFDKRFANAKDFHSSIDYNILDETSFGNLRYKWLDNPNLVDERDALHQQGWTLFHISGQVNELLVSGTCRIPFVYNQYQDTPPLLVLHIGHQFSVIDTPNGAFVVDANRKVIASYPAGSFFKGLMRPWTGLHTIDSVRRDAATCRIPFELENLDHDGYSYQRRIVTLRDAPGYDALNVSIDVNIDKNQISVIELARDNTSLGILKFSYPADPESIFGTVEIPAIKTRWFSDEPPLGIAWLFELARGTLDKQ